MVPSTLSFFMLWSDRWYVFKHCGRPNHLSKCAWNLNCHCGRKACSSTSPHYGNCHYGTSHGGIISLCKWCVKLDMVRKMFKNGSEHHFFEHLASMFKTTNVNHLNSLGNTSFEHQKCLKHERWCENMNTRMVFNMIFWTLHIQKVL